MAVPVPAQKAPYKVRLESGKKYAWCACGRSANQPFCDGSHSGTDIFPKVFAAQEICPTRNQRGLAVRVQTHGQQAVLRRDTRHPLIWPFDLLG